MEKRETESMHPLRPFLIAAATAIVFAGMSLAQTPEPTTPEPAPQSEPAPKDKAKQKTKLTPEEKKARKDKRKESRKALRQSCRAEAKKQGVRGKDALREYVQGCMKEKAKAKKKG
jgi:hypothetical protein